MKKNKQGSRTRVTVKNTTERRESRRHDQKETLFFDIKSLFTPRRGKKLKTNRYMLQTSIIVVALFLGLIGYVVKFTLKDSSSVAQSSYNKRNSSLSDQTKRGQILSANQKILAYSENNEAGDEIRHYPYENMFAHIIGYTSYGKAGLESVCNSDLLTSHEKLMKQLSNGVASKKNIGDNVITTLDTRLQKAAYEALEDYRGAVVAIEPKTGKVRALVSKPDFDPNKLDDIWDKITSDSSESCLLNRATQGLYPPGSTYKVLTALQYMEEHPNSYKNFSYECDGQTIVNSVRISCYENEEHGEVDLDRAFAKSCNTAFVTLGSKLDIKNFVSLNKKCLFNQEIPFDLAVKKSRFELTQNSDKSEIPQTVIGQGNTLMTPFHNALLMCAVANEGTLMKPYVVDHVEGADGTTVKETIPEIYADLMSEKDAKKLQKMLREVVTSGTGYNLDTDLYTAAGKTGTAENEGKYAHAWFVGYSNVEDPDLVVCVLVENVGAGSKYAVPIAKRVFDSYYNNNMKEYYSQKTDIESTQTNQ